MSLVTRTPRPLDRSRTKFRDDRLFIVACDDTYAPKQYLAFLRLSRVHVHVVPTIDGTSNAIAVLERLLSCDFEPQDERWLLLDTDHTCQGTHLKSLTSALQQARANGVNVAMSRPSFEFWLLLHHTCDDSIRELRDARATEKMLSEVLGGYNKTRLSPEHYPMDLIERAYVRAKSIDAGVSGGDIPAENTTRVFRLLHAIASKALASELPPELRRVLLVP